MSGQNNAGPSHVPSSPHSTGSVTRYGSPSTIPTIVSPDRHEDGKEAGEEVPTLELTTPTSSLRQCSIGTHDSISRRRKLTVPPVIVPHVQFLSPTAEEFTPGLTATFPNPFPSGKPSGNTGGSKEGTHLSPAQPGVIGSTRSAHPVGPQLPVLSAAYRELATAKFTVEDEMTRAFMVTGVNPQATNYQYIAHAFQNFKSLITINARGLSSGYFSVEFADFKEAKQACVLALSFVFQHQGVRIYKLFPKDIVATKGGSPYDISQYEAEYIVNLIDLDPRSRKANVTPDDIVRACMSQGELKAVLPVQAKPGCVMSFRIEWCDTRAPVAALNGAPVGGYRLAIERHTPDVDPRYTAPLPTLPKAYDEDDHKHTFALMDYLRRPSVAKQSPNGIHNFVDINRILLGQDVRTTIMLRNIPNRVDQAALKDLLDQTSKGAYDFMYLRIDFANNCNVGYAFINFVDPMSIIPFAKLRAGRRWNLFNSDKVAEISYATIQGRDCLIQKFRNSSVMLERPQFRPKLYTTGAGSSAGLEEPFPGPDNQAKLKRSCDNAEHVGLYYPPCGGTPTTPTMSEDLTAPVRQLPGGVYSVPALSRRAIRVNQTLAQKSSPYVTSSLSSTDSSPTSLYAPREGQAYRERQKRQFSQYDRGTLFAEQELAHTSAFSGATRSNSMSVITSHDTPVSHSTQTRFSSPSIYRSPMSTRPSTLTSTTALQAVDMLSQSFGSICLTDV